MEGSCSNWIRIEGFSKETIKMRHANCRPSRSCYQKHSLRWKPCGKSRLAASSLKILKRCSQVQVGFLNPQQYDDEHLAHRAFVLVQTRWRQFWLNLEGNSHTRHSANLDAVGSGLVGLLFLQRLTCSNSAFCAWYLFVYGRELDDKDRLLH